MFDFNVCVCIFFRIVVHFDSIVHVPLLYNKHRPAPHPSSGQTSAHCKSHNKLTESNFVSFCAADLNLNNGLCIAFGIGLEVAELDSPDDVLVPLHPVLDGAAHHHFLFFGQAIGITAHVAIGAAIEGLQR